MGHAGEHGSLDELCAKCQGAYLPSSAEYWQSGESYDKDKVQILDTTEWTTGHTHPYPVRKLDAANLEGLEEGWDGFAIVDCSPGWRVLRRREEVDSRGRSVDDRHGETE